ncbi:MAG: hypothetical protein JWM34_2652 [Ilumatobacteraceae bacterium]|nr:hypothetical protein [Ilumatobacteraceae bacterium]
MNDNRIEELEAQVARLTALVERLTPAASEPRAGGAVAGAGEPVTDTEHEPSQSSRRGMLKLAGAAAVGAVAVAVGGNALPAAATTGQPMLIGAANNPTLSTDLTVLTGNFNALNDSGTSAIAPSVNGVISAINQSTTSDSLVRGAILGVGGNPNGTSHGVVGNVVSIAKGSAVYGQSDSTTVGVSAGVLAKSATGPSIQLVPVASGPPTTGAWTVGAIQPDTTGRLFYCVASGTPGTWKELTATPATPVTLHIINPVRVYDSRLALPTPGKLATGLSRVVSVKDSRDSTTGAVLVPDVVPVGATAIVGNLTITKTVGSGGFLSVVPGDATSFSSSSINWFGPNQDLANGITAKIDATRSVKVFCGGDNATDFVIDVTGFYL